MSAHSKPRKVLMERREIVAGFQDLEKIQRSAFSPGSTKWDLDKVKLSIFVLCGMH
jgi:hypothetical protein